MGNTWTYLDMTALGRQEDWEDSPEGYPQTEKYTWWRRHDEYGEEISPDFRAQIDRAVASGTTGGSGT